MESIQYVLLAAVIAGVNELIKRLRGKDYWTALTIFSAAVIGGLFGAFGVENLTLITGIAAGFGASGAITVVSKLGVGSPVVPTDAVGK